MDSSRSQSTTVFPGLMALAASEASRMTLHPSQSELRKLTEAVCAGDEAAFTRFYDLYSLRLYKYLLVLAKGNETDAREVLQTVVVKLTKKFKVFEAEPQLWAWLCRLAINAYIDLCRARGRDRHIVPLELHEAGLQQPPPAEHHLAASLRHALEQLAPEDGELLRAAYVDGRPLQELADESGQTYKALESKLSRLRQKTKLNLLTHLRHEES